jgi:hypothetical protein
MADYSITEAARKRQELLAAAMKPVAGMRKIPEFEEENKSEFLVQPELTSEFTPSKGFNKLEPKEEKPRSIPKKKSGAWTAALIGAAGALQAPVGPGIPGQEFRQALARGIYGSGLVAGGIQKSEAAAAERESKLSDTLQALMAREAMKPTSKQKAQEALEIAEATYPIKSRLAKESAGYAFQRAQALKDKSISEAATESDRRGWEWAWNKAITEAQETGQMDDKELSRIAYRNFANWKNPKAPKIPKLPD